MRRISTVLPPFALLAQYLKVRINIILTSNVLIADHVPQFAQLADSEELATDRAPEE
jgi:hypothetical protein